MRKGQEAIKTERGLTPLQENFCHEYLVDLDPGKAYIRAGYKTKPAYARKHGLDLLKNHRIEMRVHELMELRSRMTDVTAERVVQELARIGFSDLRELVSWGPNETKWKASSELSDEAAAVVKEIYETEREMDDGGVYRTKRIQMHDKMAALKELAKHTGVGSGDKGLNVNVNIDTERENQKTLVEYFEDIDNWRAEQEKALAEERADEERMAS